MSLLDLINDARVPKVIKGRLSAAEREQAERVIAEAAQATYAGTARRAFYLDLFSALIGQAGLVGSEVIRERAARAAMRAVEAELERARIESEEHHEG